MLPSTRRLLFAAALLPASALAAGCASDSRAADAGPERGRAAAGPGSLFGDLTDFTGLAAEPEATASSAFWEHWGDGKAELSGYRLTVSRYGEPREGEAALIYVTEPHDRRSWIKDDRVEPPHRVEVLKLIRSVQFLTGVYPYSVHSAVFTPVDRWGGERFQPVRINLAAQEWCGSVSQRVFPGPDRLRSLRLSYFAGEGETLDERALPPGTLFEEALLVQLRELDGPFNGGEDWEGWLVPELWNLRAGHRSLEPVRARITRSEAARDGAPVTRFVLEAGEYRRTFDVERAEPRRILGWETSTGDRAELLDTERLAYWSLNRPGDERLREALGLSAYGPLAAVGGGCQVPAEGAGG